MLRSDNYQAFFDHMYGDVPYQWSPQLEGWERLRFVTNCLTRLRYCDKDGRLDLTFKGAPSTQDAHLAPWFAAPNRRNRETEIVFGHWSTLGFYAGDGCYCLDSGCLWGGELTALRLDGEKRRTSVSCRASLPPGSVNT